MITSIRSTQSTIFHKTICSFILLTFMSTVAIPPSIVSAQAVASPAMELPTPGVMVPLSPAYTPALIMGLEVHPDNPLQFDFIVHRGQSKLKGEALKNESHRMIKYFLASLTVPDDEMWVNLSPYEKDQIIPESFGVTEMGRDLLAQDYLLKQLTASLIYPEDQLGQSFWKRVRERAHEEYGAVELPVNTFNKVWIVPDRAEVFEQDNIAYIADSHLKVLLEDDYLALENNSNSTRFRTDEVANEDVKEMSEMTAPIVREIILPEIEKEINSGQTFAQLRQVYNSMILATWYKQALKESLLGKVYINQNKVAGIDLAGNDAKLKIYDRYMDAFKKGVYNYIRKDYDQYAQKPVPRKYFSGGISGFDPTNTGFGAVAEVKTVRTKGGLSEQGRINIQTAGEDSAMLTSVTVNIVEANPATQKLAGEIAKTVDDPLADDDVFADLAMLTEKEEVVLDILTAVPGRPYELGVLQDAYISYTKGEELDNDTAQTVLAGLVEKGLAEKTDGGWRATEEGELALTVDRAMLGEQAEALLVWLASREKLVPVSERQIFASSFTDQLTRKGIRTTMGQRAVIKDAVFTLRDWDFVVPEQGTSPEQYRITEKGRVYVHMLGTATVRASVLRQWDEYDAALWRVLRSGEIKGPITPGAVLETSFRSVLEENRITAPQAQGAFVAKSLDVLGEAEIIRATAPAQYELVQTNTDRAMLVGEKNPVMIEQWKKELWNSPRIADIQRILKENPQGLTRREIQKELQNIIILDDTTLSRILVVMKEQGLVTEQHGRIFREIELLKLFIYKGMQGPITVESILDSSFGEKLEVTGRGMSDFFKEAAVTAELKRLAAAGLIRPAAETEPLEYTITREGETYILDHSVALVKTLLAEGGGVWDLTDAISVGMIQNKVPKASEVIKRLIEDGWLGEPKTPGIQQYPIIRERVEQQRREVMLAESVKTVKSMLTEGKGAWGYTDSLSVGMIQRYVSDPTAVIKELIRQGWLGEPKYPGIQQYPILKRTPGGIDFNAAHLNLQIKRDGNGVPLPISQQPIEQMQIDGFLPVIINIAPVMDLPLLLGLAEHQTKQKQAKQNKDLDPAKHPAREELTLEAEADELSLSKS